MGGAMESFIEKVVPFVVMEMVECGEIEMITLGKAAMNQGLSNLVYVVYYNALGTVILLPNFIFHCCRNNRLPLTLSVLSKLFGLGFLGMEKFEIKKSTSQAKALGTMVGITGAFVMTLYQGPALFKSIIGPGSHENLLSSQQSNWVLGGLLITITAICSSSWNVFQAIFGTAIRSTVITWCLRKKGPVYVSMFKPVSMVIAVIMGIMFLGDILHLGSVIGAVIIALGVYTVLWGQTKEHNLVINDVSRLESSTENTPLVQK